MTLLWQRLEIVPETGVRYFTAKKKQCQNLGTVEEINVNVFHKDKRELQELLPETRDPCQSKISVLYLPVVVVQGTW